MLKDDTGFSPQLRKSLLRSAIYMMWFMRIVGPLVVLAAFWLEQSAVADTDAAAVVALTLLGLGWTAWGWFGQRCNPRNSELVYLQLMIAGGVIWVVVSFAISMITWVVVTLLSS